MLLVQGEERGGHREITEIPILHFWIGNFTSSFFLLAVSASYSAVSCRGVGAGSI